MQSQQASRTTAGRLRVSRKESEHMSIEFFKLPAALKKAIWAAYLAEWKKKQAAKKPATH
jgi:hypothetical protein